MSNKKASAQGPVVAFTCLCVYEARRSRSLPKIEVGSRRQILKSTKSSIASTLKHFKIKIKAEQLMFKQLSKIALLSHSCFVKKYKMRAYQWENDFNTFFAVNSHYIMIFWILQQRWDMLVLLGGHLVNIGDGYW